MTITNAKRFADWLRLPYGVGVIFLLSCANVQEKEPINLDPNGSCTINRTVSYYSDLDCQNYDGSTAYTGYCILTKKSGCKFVLAECETHTTSSSKNNIFKNFKENGNCN